MVNIVRCKLQFLMGTGIFCILNDHALFLKRYGVVDLSDFDKNAVPSKLKDSLH